MLSCLQDESLPALNNSFVGDVTVSVGDNEVFSVKTMKFGKAEMK